MKIGLFVMVVAGLSALFLFYVWGKMDVVRVGYELDQLSKRKAALEQEHDRLRMTYLQLTAPDKIAQEAATKLGMRPPAPGQVILVSSDEIRRGKKQREGAEPLRVARTTVSRGRR